MKCWIDGSCDGEKMGKLGLAVVFEDNKILKRVDFGTSLDAEILSCIMALQYLKKNNHFENIIYTDNKTLSKFLDNPYKLALKKFSPPLLKLLKETKTEIRWIHKKKNRVADKISKEIIKEK